jgi:hypothetical protein
MAHEKIPGLDQAIVKTVTGVLTGKGVSHAQAGARAQAKLAEGKACMLAAANAEKGDDHDALAAGFGALQLWAATNA